jgi:hypothetical protein
LRLRLEPKRCTNVTAPHSEPASPPLRARLRHAVKIDSTKMRESAVKHVRLERGERPKLEREREHELPDRHRRQDAIDEVRCGVRHAPARAARTHRAPLTGKCDEQIVSAHVAVHAHEAVRKDAAAQIRAQLRLHIPRERFA